MKQKLLSKSKNVPCIKINHYHTKKKIQILLYVSKITEVRVPTETKYKMLEKITIVVVDFHLKVKKNQYHNSSGSANQLLREHHLYLKMVNLDRFIIIIIFVTKQKGDAEGQVLAKNISGRAIYIKKWQFLAISRK